MYSSGRMNTNTDKSAQAKPGRQSPREVEEVAQPQPLSERIDRLLSRAEFAKALNVCTHTVARMERRGLIRGIHINPRLVRYPTSELTRLIREAA